MSEVLIYVVGVDLERGSITPLWHIPADNGVEIYNGERRIIARCGKPIRVVISQDSDPGDEDLCSQCWRNARCTQ